MTPPRRSPRAGAAGGRTPTYTPAPRDANLPIIRGISVNIRPFTGAETAIPPAILNRLSSLLAADLDLS